MLLPFPDPDLTRLIDRALTAAVSSAATGALNAIHAALERRGQALHAIHAALQHELVCATPPPEIVAALRSPRGTPCLVRLALPHRARVVIHPLGAASPAREAEVWESLATYFHGHGLDEAG